LEEISLWVLRDYCRGGQRWNLQKYCKKER